MQIYHVKLEARERLIGICITHFPKKDTEGRVKVTGRLYSFEFFFHVCFISTDCLPSKTKHLINALIHCFHGILSKCQYAIITCVLGWKGMRSSSGQ